jgi:GNAT superfamily N-acetyltransferase
MRAISIRDARAADRARLNDLKRLASMYSPTYREQLAAHPELLEVSAEQIDRGMMRVAEQAGVAIGFAVLLSEADGACELDGLFVAPERMRAGVGRLLVEDAKRIARDRGAARIEVVANPDAAGFYQRLGFIGDEEVTTRFGPARRMRLET